MATKLRELFPQHTRYAEPFFGSGAVLFAGDGDNVAEYANDLDGELANFWKVMQHKGHFEDFLRIIEATPLSEGEFEYAKKAIDQLTAMWPDSRIPGGVERIKRAVWFFIVNRQSRQALGRDFATPTSRLRRRMNEQVSAWLTAVDGLPQFHARLRRVEIRNMPAVDFIRELDSPDTLFYCDPPYVHEARATTGEYKHEMTAEQHWELLDLLGRIKGKFLLSGYRCDIYDSMANRCEWRRIDFDLPNNASGKATKERKNEAVWMNYR